MSLLQVRVAAGVLALLALAWAVYRRKAVAAGVRRYLFEPGTPEKLALLRIGLFGGLAWVALKTKAVWWASQPAALRVLPPGWAWAEGVLPIDESSARFAQYLVVGGALLTVVGLATRVAAPVAAVAAVYLLATPSFFGKVMHMDHALVMMALVVSVSPCGDAWSIDRLVRRARGEPAPGPSPAYTLPMRLGWLLLGSVYLFPGLWKIWENGDLWLNGQRLLWELHDEWGHQKGLQPPFRIDEYPWMLKLAGTATLIFEVGFTFALFHPAGRVVAALSACAFHVGVRLFLGIRFYEYLPLLMLIDQPWVRPRAAATGAAAASGPALARALWPAAAVGSVLLLGQCAVAAARIETFPIALHPVFGERVEHSEVTYDHKVRLVPKDGSKTRNLVYALAKRGGGRGFLRMVLRFDRDVANKIPRQKTSREIVAMLRDNGIDVHEGDAIELYKTQWNTFPLKERTGYKQELKRRYVVTEDYGLEAE